MNLTICVSDDLYQRAVEIAAENKVPVEDLFASALENHIHEFERLQAKASQGSYEKFRQVMSKVPAVEPPEYDQL